MTTPLQIQITVGKDGLVEGLKVATKGVDDASQSMKASLKGMGEAAGGAGKAQEGLLSTLKEFKKEQTQQGRLGKFYASELASIIPASAGAKGALQGVLGAGLELAAGGGLLAVGFELAKVGVEHLVAAVNEENDAMVAAKKSATDTSNSIADSFRQVANSSAKPMTAAMTAYRDGIQQAAVAARNLDQQIQALRDDSSAAASVARFFGATPNRAEIGKLEGQKAAVENTAAAELPSALAQGRKDEAPKLAFESSQKILAIRASTADEIRRIELELTAKLAEIERNRLALGQHADELRVATIRQSDEQLERAKLSREIQFNAEILPLRVQALSDQERIAAESAARVDKINLQFLNRRKAADLDQKQQLLRQESFYTERQLELAEAAHDKFVSGALKADEDATRASIDRRIAYQQRLVDQWKSDHEFFVAAVGAGVGAFTQGVGDGLLGIIEGTKSVEQAFKDLASNMVSSILSALEQIAAQKIAKSIFDSILDVGPSGGGGLLGTILSGLGLLALAGGGDFSSGQPLLVGEHGPELMVPQQSGSVIPNHALGGSTTFIFNAPVDRSWWDANQRHIVATLADARRMGRTS